MTRTRLAALTALTTLLLAASTPGSTPNLPSEKTELHDAPAIAPRLRHTASAVDKAATTAKADIARLARERALSAQTRAASDSTAAKTVAASPKIDQSTRLAAHTPHLQAGETSKIASFVGRNGTGLGDIYEDESNDEAEEDEAQILNDLPVNVVGSVDDDDDFDFFAVFAYDGEIVRGEVVADRVFGTPLDSYLFVVDDEGDIVADNDDGFAGSFDSFVLFEAPYTGVFFVGLTDVRGEGDDDYQYVLNLATSDDTDYSEAEPNDNTSTSDPVAIPGLAFGTAGDDDDLDVFRFTAPANASLVVDVDAEIFLSEMDAVVELYDGAGRFLFGNDDFDGRDPRFNLVLPASGTYYLAVYDLQGDGDDDNYYSVNVSLQSAALAPRISSLKFSSGRLKTVKGAGFVPANGGADVEIDGGIVPSYHYSSRPTTELRLSPTQTVRSGDVVTVVNPDGRRSNPRII